MYVDRINLLAAASMLKYQQQMLLFLTYTSESFSTDDTCLCTAFTTALELKHAIYGQL
jgi:hypothetical protein